MISSSMILRTKPRARIRQPEVEYQLKAARYWLALSAALCAAASAGPPPAPQPRSPQSPPPDARGAEPPDEGLIEFLGADDVGDADWWEFLKKAAPRRDQPPVPPPQDAKQ